MITFIAHDSIFFVNLRKIELLLQKFLKNLSNDTKLRHFQKFVIKLQEKLSIHAMYEKIQQPVPLWWLWQLINQMFFDECTKNRWRLESSSKDLSNDINHRYFHQFGKEMLAKQRRSCNFGKGTTTCTPSWYKNGI